jgi:hypothetical protein
LIKQINQTVSDVPTSQLENYEGGTNGTIELPERLLPVHYVQQKKENPVKYV